MKIKKSKRMAYASKKRNDKAKQEMVRNTGDDWADWVPRRDYGVFANAMTTYRHNGETKWT